MAFEFENEIVHPEVQQGVTTTIRVYPTDGGQRVETTGTPTFEVLDPGGASLASGSITPVSATFGTRSVHRLDVAIPAQSDLDENYILRVNWVPSGGTETRVETILFDVVLAPLGEGLSLSDLRELRVDVDVDLDRMGVRLGQSTGQTAQEFATQILARRAREQMFAWLRAAGDRPRPYQIIERRALNAVERRIALRDLYEGVTRDPGAGERSADALYRHYRDEARAAFEALRIAYSTDDDLIPDKVASSLGASFGTERVQS